MNSNNNECDISGGGGGKIELLMATAARLRVGHYLHIQESYQLCVCMYVFCGFSLRQLYRECVCHIKKWDEEKSSVL